MTKRTPKLTLLVAAAAGFCLLAGSAANAGTSIAPFTMNIKSKIYSFNFPTGGGGTFSCAACYAPTALFSSSGTAGGGLYFYGPQFTAPRLAPHPTPTSGYYFNPYWGAAYGGAISSYGQADGTPHSPAVATLQSDASRPNFHVEPSQPGLVGIKGYVSFGPGGNYLGTTNNFVATNANFNVGEGNGPGNTVYSGFAGKGKVTYTEGTDHTGGFGGTLKWIGGSVGNYLIKTSVGGNGNCAVGATQCYYRVPINGAVGASNGTGLGQNSWVDTITYDFVNVFNGGATTTAVPSGTIVTRFLSHAETTGGVVMTQPFPSLPTIHSTHGSDARTSRGVGNITLVAGWVGHTETATTTSDWGGTTVSKFRFHFAPETPSLASPALGALGGLMAIAAVYVIRKRNSSN